MAEFISIIMIGVFWFGIWAGENSVTTADSIKYIKENPCIEKEFAGQVVKKCYEVIEVTK